MRATVLYSNGVDPAGHWRPNDADRARYADRRRRMRPEIERRVVSRAARIRQYVPELFRTAEDQQIIVWADTILARTSGVSV